MDDLNTSVSLIVSPTEIMDPLTGEILDVGSSDGLINVWERLCAIDSAIRTAKLLIRDELGVRATEGDGRTKFVQGETRTAKIVLPSSKWNQQRMRELWDRFPRISGEYLRITELAPNLGKVNKLRSTTAEGDLETFRILLLASEQDPTTAPTITIER